MKPKNKTMRQKIETIVNRLSIRGGYSTDEAIDDILELFDTESKDKSETIILLENRLKGFKLHYAVDEINEENKQLKSDIAKVEYECENIKDANLKWQNKFAELEEENAKLKK